MDFMGGGEGREAPPPPPPVPLARQGSIYSLTFDEYQSTVGGLGKDFGSMNMDELLKNIWTAEESLAVATALGESAGGAGLQRQGSLTLPRTLSQKTVDEVWRDLVGAPSAQGPTGGGADVPRQPTLGEMTLEEFLVRAGVVREDLAPPPALPRPVGNESNTTSLFFGDLVTANNSTGLALGFSKANRSNGNMVNAPILNSSAANLGVAAAAARPYAASMPLESAMGMGTPKGMRGGGLVSFGDGGMDNRLMTGMVGISTAVAAKSSPANHLSSDGLGKGNGALSSASPPVPYAFSDGLRGRKCSATVEKVVERRQKRMIKNRESAARSRARKQAYTMELEDEVAKLKEQNQELMKKQCLQAEMTEMQKNQVLQLINQQQGPKKQCLRRTLTGPW